MEHKNVSSWSITTIVFVSLVLWVAIVRQRETSASTALARMEVSAPTMKMDMFVSAQLDTVVQTVSFWEAAVKTSLACMEALALIKDLTSNASVQLEQLEKPVSKTPEMSAHITLASMGAALIELAILTAHVTQSGEERIVKLLTKLHQEELISQTDFTK